MLPPTVYEETTMRKHRVYSEQQKRHRALRAMKRRAHRHEILQTQAERRGEPTKVFILRPRSEEMRQWIDDWLSVSHFHYVKCSRKEDLRDEKRYNRERNEKFNGRPTNLFSSHYIHSWEEGTGHWPFPLLRPAFVHDILTHCKEAEYWLEQERDLDKEEQMNEDQMCKVLGITPPNLSAYGIQEIYYSQVSNPNEW